ncbi:small integral membrane protein 40-like [Mus pahari]|uniref:small integral membrane protein 40-like n=1 Tax=Mus pahari TaxID=10093 RepID=UPI001114E3AB|nr:small integral membrane protein 40-like [Mus pahari]
MVEEEEGGVEEGDVFLAFAQGPIPPRGPVRRALDKIFLAFLVLFLTLLTLEAAYKLLWPLPWAKFRDWLLRTPEGESTLEL